MKKKFTAFCLFTLVVFTGYSQNNDTRTVLQVQKLDSNTYVRLSNDSGHYHLAWLDSNDKIESTTTVDSIAFSSGNPIQRIHIQFLNQQTGFLCGYESGYGYYPFVFKTSDSGQHWKRVLFEKSDWGCPLRPSDFFMFDVNRGIVVANWHNVNSLDYYLTNDGGETWKKNKFRMRDSGVEIKNHDAYLKTVFSADGQITCLVMDPDLEYGVNTTAFILKSDDFGKSFRILK